MLLWHPAGRPMVTSLPARPRPGTAGVHYVQRDGSIDVTKQQWCCGEALLGPSRWSTTIASATALALGLSLAAGVGSRSAASLAPRRRHQSPAPRSTRSLVAGRGAQVDFVEQEAENATTTGTVLAPDRLHIRLAAEASGRSAVTLDRRGSTSSSPCPRAANAITVRYSIPDSATGGGITSPLGVTVNGGHRKTLTLTSQYAWLYNLYPFTNDPNADVLHPDWWITECSCVPDATTPTPVVSMPFRPNHFYDEQRTAAGPDLPSRRQGAADRSDRARRPPPST